MWNTIWFNIYIFFWNVLQDFHSDESWEPEAEFTRLSPYCTIWMATFEMCELKKRSQGNYRYIYMSCSHSSISMVKKVWLTRRKNFSCWFIAKSKPTVIWILFLGILVFTELHGDWTIFYCRNQEQINKISNQSQYEKFPAYLRRKSWKNLSTFFQRWETTSASLGGVLLYLLNFWNFVI
jgi:hypothetical protein